jgi:protein associated with RNAse G/E
MISVGQTITVRALHADGECYRHWQATVERIDADVLVTLFMPGQLLHNLASDRPYENYIRTFYWFEQLYNLLEVYAPDGTFIELYINVAGKPKLNDNVLTFTDHELDVSMLPGHAPELLDEDEFAESIVRYAYTPEFVAQCRRVSQHILYVAQEWIPAGLQLLPPDIQGYPST